jgi:hypothetical protein
MWREWLCAQPDTGSGPTQPASSHELGRFQRTRQAWLLLPLFLGGWVLLNPRRHLVFVGSHCSLVMLSKTSEATHGTYIGEASWDAFASRHPLLMARLMAGEGVWILGSRHA